MCYSVYRLYDMSAWRRTLQGILFGLTAHITMVNVADVHKKKKNDVTGLPVFHSHDT